MFEQGINALEHQKNILDSAVYQEHKQQFTVLHYQYLIQSQCFSEAENRLAELKENEDEKIYCSELTLYATKLAEADLHSQAEEILQTGLKHYKNNQQLVMQLAELAQLQGRIQQAVHLLRGIIKKDKGNPELWIKLSNTFGNGESDPAKETAEKAIELLDSMQESEEFPVQRINFLKLQSKQALAQAESQAENFEIAEKLFKELIESNPFFVPALRGLGQQYMQQGKIELALELFEKVKQIEPVSGYSALINARRFPEDIETLEKLDKAARVPSLEGSTRNGLLFQLAAAWEKRKDYDKAFSYAQEANELCKRFLKYDPQKHRQSCARTRFAFCKELYEHRKGHGLETTLPIYILGMPRSGTTLVEQIIAGHSQIFGAGELGVMPSRIQGLNRWERHVGSGRKYPDCVDDLTKGVTQGIAQQILDELQEYNPQAKHIVDKLPHNFENIGLIKFFFPKAKIISVRRDPRDIAISNYFTDYQAKHGGMGFAYDLEWIGQQLADHNLFMHHWHQVFPGEILEINYEDVIEDTESMARTMLDYIGVKWEEQVLDFTKLDRPVKTASVWQVRQPIYKTSKAKWMRYQNHISPLIKGTNARIEWDPIEMITLPESGFQTTGAELYKKDDLDGAEISCKKMLHHNPEHAAANYIVGLIYCRKQHIKEGIEFMEKAVKKCPWQREWKENLKQARELLDNP